MCQGAGSVFQMVTDNQDCRKGRRWEARVALTVCTQFFLVGFLSMWHSSVILAETEECRNLSQNVDY